jgi:YbbR domain-containing protein
MVELLRRFGKQVPTLLLALALAVTVWVTAVTEADPVEERLFPRQIPIEVIGQAPNMVLTSNIPAQVTLTLSAPHSIWTRITNEQVQVKAVVDITGLGAGNHTQPVQIQIGIRPVQIISFSPNYVEVDLEPLATKNFSIHLIQKGDLAVGFQAGTPEISATSATISGPESIVNRVADVRAVLDISQAQETINRTLQIETVDNSEQPVSGLTISPENITVNEVVSQRGGYRNVVVKAVLSGQVANGYRLTNISVSPPAVTVFSTNPQLIENLPGFVETTPIDISGAKDDLDVHPALNLPGGVSAVGLQNVEVQVGVSAIEGSVTLTNMPVTAQGLQSKYAAKFSPVSVDVILSGPLPILDKLAAKDVIVTADLTGLGPGIVQRPIQVTVQMTDIKVETILPGTVEVTIVLAPPVTATPKPK